MREGYADTSDTGLAKWMIAQSAHLTVKHDHNILSLHSAFINNRLFAWCVYTILPTVYTEFKAVCYKHGAATCVKTGVFVNDSTVWYAAGCVYIHIQYINICTSIYLDMESWNKSQLLLLLPLTSGKGVHDWWVAAVIHFSRAVSLSLFSE